MRATTAAVLPINAPAVQWAKLKPEERLAVKRAVRADRTLSDGAKVVYDTIFDHCWHQGRAKLLQRRIAEEAGMPLSTMKRHLKELRERGHITACRFSYITEWRVFFAPETDSSNLGHEIAQARAISRETDNNSLRARDIPRASSSSNNEQSSETETQKHSSPQPNEEKPSYEGVNAIGGPEAASKSPRERFIDRFRTKYPQAPELSRKDLDWIENQLGPRGLNWDTFAREIWPHCAGNATNPIGLVKSFAKEFAARTRPPKVVSMNRWQREDDGDWNKRCPTCKSRGGLLPDGTPCPDCQLGRDLALDQMRQERKAQLSLNSDNAHYQERS